MSRTLPIVNRKRLLTIRYPAHYLCQLVFGKVAYWGPLLFISYINNMPNIVKHCKIILYADETLLFYSYNSVKDIEQCVNEDLHSICKWRDENLLPLNWAKSKFLLFGVNRRLKTFTNISIYVNEQQLAREQITFKYLGITFSENLTWSDHLSNVLIKNNQRIGLLIRVKVFIPLKARLIQSTILSSCHYLTTMTLYGVIRTTPSSWMNYKFFRTRLQRRFLMLLTYPPPLRLSQTYTGTHLRRLPTVILVYAIIP